jgi:hypothetical protein
MVFVFSPPRFQFTTNEPHTRFAVQSHILVEMGRESPSQQPNGKPSDIWCCFLLHGYTLSIGESCDGVENM